MADTAAALPAPPPIADHASPVDHANGVDQGLATGDASTPRLDDAAVEQRLAMVEDLLGRLEQVPGRTAELALEAVETLVEVYGEAFARIVTAARDAPGVLTALTEDELIRHLLLLHQVHPGSVEERVARAVADAAPALRSRGASADVVGVDEGVVQLVVSSGSCGHCGASTEAQAQVADEVLAAAPELVGVRFVDPPRTTAVIPVEALLRRPSSGTHGQTPTSPRRAPG
jgi:hypothetical protein